MSKARAIIDQIFQDGDRSVLAKYQGRELDFFLERGRLYPEKLEEMFWAIVRPTHDDLIIIGPRGGGKTMGVYDAATARFMFLEDDVFAIGGSEKQAENGFRYMRQLLYADEKLAGTLQDGLKTRAVGPRGNWFEIAAASQKGVRGPHPGDKHPEMGWVNHGGVLIKDERDEMDDEIADAADFTMDTAEPSIIISTSTMHRDDGGGIAQMAEEAEARGARVIKFDALDVCEVCMHDCAACPGGFPFAGALYGGLARTSTDKHGLTPTNTDKKARKGGRQNANPTPPALPQVTVNSMSAWNAFKSSNAWPVDEPAYCLGRAKTHRPGHLKMSKIFRAFKRSRNREIFEVELMCRKRKGARRVVDGAALDRCLEESTAYRSGYETPIITIDWGLKGWCVPILIQGQMDNTIAVIDVHYEHMTSVDGIVEICKEWQNATGAYKVYADSSHPYENLKMAENGFTVVEVPFVKFKEFGAGWVRGIVERNQLRLPGKIIKGGERGEKPQYVFGTDAVEELFKQTKGWQRDKHGKIVKKDDHGPDSLSCAAQHFAESNDWEPDFESAGSRDVSGWGY